MTSSLELVDRAIHLLDEGAIAVARSAPPSAELIEHAEHSMGVEFPAAFRYFQEKVGAIAIATSATGGGGLTIMGVTDKPVSVGLLFNLRSAESRRFLDVAETSEPEWPYVTQYIAIDLEAGPGSEGPVVLHGRNVVTSPAPSHNSHYDWDTIVPMADNFGAWLLDAIDDYLPRALAMWHARLSQPVHHVTTDSRPHGHLGAFSSTCTCGWLNSELSLTWAQEVAHDHMAHPEKMHATAWW